MSGQLFRVELEKVVLEERLKRPKQALQEIGNFLVRQARRAFDEQGRGNVSWLARKVPNVLGAVRDLQKSASVKLTRFQDRPALVDTGGLKNTLRVKVTGNDTVEVVSLKSYASKHQEGGEGSERVTSTVRKNLKAYLRANPERRAQLGFLFRRSEVSTEVPPRPFLTVADSDIPEIEKIVKEHLDSRGGQQPPAAA